MCECPSYPHANVTQNATRGLRLDNPPEYFPRMKDSVTYDLMLPDYPVTG